jgi:hypothetical protein
MSNANELIDNMRRELQDLSALVQQQLQRRITQLESPPPR